MYYFIDCFEEHLMIMQVSWFKISDLRKNYILERFLQMYWFYVYECVACTRMYITGGTFWKGNHFLTAKKICILWLSTVWGLLNFPTEERNDLRELTLGWIIWWNTHEIGLSGPHRLNLHCCAFHCPRRPRSSSAEVIDALSFPSQGRPFWD